MPRFYDRRSWRRTARAYLTQHPLCVECQAQGRTTPATQVDHLVPLEHNPAPYSWESLQGLCAKHHALKTWQTEQGHTYREPGCDATGLPHDRNHWWRSTP